MRIRKNSTKKIAKLVNNITKATVFTLDNYFKGEDVSLDRDFTQIIRNELDQYRGGPLTVDQDRSVATLHVHSNYWMEFELSSADI